MGNIPGEEVREGTNVGVRDGARLCICVVPWPPGPIEGELAQGVEEVKLIEMSLAIFATETQLVFADVVRHHVGEHPCDVVTTLRGRNTNLLKATDPEVRCAKKLRRYGRVGAQE